MFVSLSFPWNFALTDTRYHYIPPVQHHSTINILLFCLVSPSSILRPGHPTLDDGFFSIDEFNRETEELESHSRSSGRLSGDDDDDGDEEDVDLFAPIDEADTQAFEEEDEDDDPSSYSTFIFLSSSPSIKN